MSVAASTERDAFHSKLSKLMPRVDKKLEMAEKSLAQAQTLLDDLIVFYGKATPDVDVSVPHLCRSRSRSYAWRRRECAAPLP